MTLGSMLIFQGLEFAEFFCYKETRKMKEVWRLIVKACFALGISWLFFCHEIFLKAQKYAVLILF